MEEKDVKKRLASWDESELLEKGVIKLVYDEGTKIEPVVCDLAGTFKRDCPTVTWDKLGDLTKWHICNGRKQKLVDGTAGKGEKAGYTLKEKREIIFENNKRIEEKLQWNKPGEGRGPITTKIASALTKASVEELAIMVKLGLTAQVKVDEELLRRETAVE